MRVIIMVENSVLIFIRSKNDVDFFFQLLEIFHFGIFFIFFKICGRDAVQPQLVHPLRTQFVIIITVNSRKYKTHICYRILDGKSPLKNKSLTFVDEVLSHVDGE